MSTGRRSQLRSRPPVLLIYITEEGGNNSNPVFNVMLHNDLHGLSSVGSGELVSHISN